MIEESPRRCPTCGYEYEPWVEACPDCGVALTSEGDKRKEKPTLDPGEDPRWTVVTNVPNAIIGSLIKSQLEDAGIPVLMNRSRSGDIGEFSHYDYVAQDLRVPASRLEEAHEIVYSRPDTPSANPYLPERWTVISKENEGTEAESKGWHMLRGVTEEHAEPKSCVDPGGSFDPHWGDEWRERRPYSEEYDDEPVGTPRWVRIFYGILLLAISLPFLLQLFGQLARIFQP